MIDCMRLKLENQNKYQDIGVIFNKHYLNEIVHSLINLFY
jgi:hypothetical protein